MEKKFYDIDVEGFEKKRWYQKRLSPAQWQALLSHAFEMFNPMHFIDATGKIQNPNALKILALISNARGKPIGEYFFGTLLIPDGEVFNYDQILPRGRLIMSIDDPDVFFDLAEKVWADFLSVNKRWFQKLEPAAASLKQTPDETPENSSPTSTPTSKPQETDPMTDSSGVSAEETSPDSNTSETTSPSS